MKTSNYMMETASPYTKAVVSIKHNFGSWMLLMPSIFCVYFFLIRPQGLSILWSFFEMKGYTVGKFVGLDNFIRVIKDTMFLKTLMNTFVYVFWSLVIGYVFPILLAVLMNEMVHMRSFFRFCVYFPSALPSVAVAMLWYFIYYPDQSGLLNILLGKIGLQPYVWLQDVRWTIFFIILSMTWSSAGATAMYYFASLQGVRRELYEAAIMDGAGFIRRFWVVTFPHISGVSLLLLIKQIIGVFSVMEQPLQMTDGGPNGASVSLGLQVYRYGFVSVRPQMSFALGTIMFLILIIITAFYFRLNKKIESNH